MKMRGAIWRLLAQLVCVDERDLTRFLMAQD